MGCTKRLNHLSHRQIGRQLTNKTQNPAPNSKPTPTSPADGFASTSTRSAFISRYTTVQTAGSRVMEKLSWLGRTAVQRRSEVAAAIQWLRHHHCQDTETVRRKSRRVRDPHLHDAFESANSTAVYFQQMLSDDMIKLHSYSAKHAFVQQTAF